MITLDLDLEGQQQGVLRIPTAYPRSAFGAVEMHVLSLRNGSGPCVVVLGGVHGDEFEGQVAVASMARQLRLAAVRGQIIFVPRANPAATYIGTRISPLDGGDLNRAFPGDLHGGPTSALAYAIETLLLPRATLVLDLHSGGDLVEYMPVAMIPEYADAGRQSRALALAGATGLGSGFTYAAEDDAPSSLFGACARLGVDVVAVEVGGGGRLSRSMRAVAEAVIDKVLCHAGVLPANVGLIDEPFCLLRRMPVRNAVLAPRDGIFEPVVEPGDEVAVGDPLALVHDSENPWTQPTEVDSPVDAVVLCRRVPAAVRRGDGLFKLGVVAGPHEDGW